MNPEPSVYLVGPRGAGKSSAGALLARRLGRPFVDADHELCRRAGRDVPRIFAEAGEAHFRSLERRLLVELLARPGLVVATGGGCVVDRGVRRALAGQPLVFWLDAPAAVLAARIRGQRGRPALWGGDPAGELGGVLAHRRGLYAACSGVRLSTGHRDPAGVAAALERLCRAIGPGRPC